MARRVLANQRRVDARRSALVELLGSLLARRPIAEPAGEAFGELGDAIAASMRPPG